MNFPIKKLIRIVDKTMNNPPPNNTFLFSLKLRIKKFVNSPIYKPIICTGWMMNLGSPINKSQPIEPKNI